MKKIQKGSYGYLKSRKILTGTAMTAGYLLVLLLFFTGIFLYADRRNLLTAAAILVCLPTGKMTVNFLMYPGRGKAELNELNELLAIAGDMPVICDLLITPEKKPVEITYAAVNKSHIIAYCTDGKLDNAYHGDFIRKFLKSCDISVDVSFYNDYGKFKKRLAALKANEPEEYSQEEKERLENIVHNFEILSI